MEHVLVAPARELAPFLKAKGLITGVESGVLDVIDKSSSFIPRDKAEDDPGFRQIIPYVVIRRGDEVFALKRLNKGGEVRLHGLLSLGIGGHINPESDGAGLSALMAGLERELHEEVYISSEGEKTLIGVINDDTNSVGSVHLGLLYMMRVHAAAQVRILETDKLEGFWAGVEELPGLAPGMETWSQLILDAIRVC